MVKITKQYTNRESQSLDKYLQEIGKGERLKAEEESDLARRIKKGDQTALEKLTKANLRDAERERAVLGKPDGRRRFGSHDKRPQSATPPLTLRRAMPTGFAAKIKGAAPIYVTQAGH